MTEQAKGCGGTGRVYIYTNSEGSAHYDTCPSCPDCQDLKSSDYYEASEMPTEQEVSGAQYLNKPLTVPKCGTCGGNVWFAGTDKPCPDCTPKPTDDATKQVFCFFCYIDYDNLCMP